MNDTGRRLDVEVVVRGLVATRSQAADLIRAGSVRLDGVVEYKASRRVTSAAVIDVDGHVAGHVGRGARKLEAALAAFDIDVHSRVALDVGASTGGFTQILLERHVSRVYAVDVGTDQLASLLRADPRVVVMEATDIRSLDLSGSAQPLPDLVVADLSFISTRLVADAITKNVAATVDAVILVKPQFELGRESLDGRGVVRDRASHLRAIQSVCETFTQAGWQFQAARPSAVVGARGNQEYFIWLSRNSLRPGYDATGPTIDVIADHVLGH